jgi:pentatricopeptide repeat domain-containing protein 3
MSRLAQEAVRTAISIPKRIKRSPTDLLKALAATVNVDTHSPHYKYLDDPFTIPYSISDRVMI